MGFMLPSTSPREHARQLIARKDELETEITEQFEILREHGSDMTSPLVDRDGFPHPDLDIYAIRHARHRVVVLRNDLKALMNEIASALEVVYEPPALPAGAAALPQGVGSPGSAAAAASPPVLRPFAKVSGVAPGSPAAEAGLQREDLLIKFGHLSHAHFPSSALEPLSDLVSRNENRELEVQVLRSGEPSTLKFTPRKGWGGRGMLGCHIVPYSP